MPVTRDVRVVLQGVDKYNTLFGAVVYPEGDQLLSLGEQLAVAGLADVRCLLTPCYDLDSSTCNTMHSKAKGFLAAL